MKKSTIVLSEIKYLDAEYVYNKFCATYLSGKVQRVSCAGEVRRMAAPVHGHVSIVCVPEWWGVNEVGVETSSVDENAFRGVLKNGPRHKEFAYAVQDFKHLRERYTDTGFIKVELFITDLRDWGRILAMRTGDSAFVRDVLASAWKRKGYCGTEHGLVPIDYCEKKGSVWRIKVEYEAIAMAERPFFSTEEEFFNFLGLKFIHPQSRNKHDWTTKRAAGKSRAVRKNKI
jgi:DNA polymerase/3'-5' exonuclease PolX